MQDYLDSIHKSLMYGGVYTDTFTDARSAKTIIGYLIKKNISFKIINRGGGVKTITTDVNTCPKCGGTGKC